MMIRLFKDKSFTSTALRFWGISDWKPFGTLRCGHYTFSNVTKMRRLILFCNSQLRIIVSYTSLVLSCALLPNAAAIFFFCRKTILLSMSQGLHVDFFCVDYEVSLSFILEKKILQALVLEMPNSEHISICISHNHKYKFAWEYPLNCIWNSDLPSDIQYRHLSIQHSFCRALCIDQRLHKVISWAV